MSKKQDKTREQELKEKLKMSSREGCIKAEAELKGRKEGIKEERERIMKIIDEWAKKWNCQGNAKDELKQKIKGDDDETKK